MADPTKVVASVDKTYADIQSVKTRMMGVTSTLNQLKIAVSTALPPPGQANASSLNLAFVRKELSKAKENVLKFKEIVKSAAEAGESTGGRMGKGKQQKDDKSRTMYERIGGDLNLEALVEVVYIKALVDSRVRSFFEINVRKLQTIRKKVFQFLSGFLGGPKLYDSTNVKPSHYHMNITDFHFDAMWDLFADTLKELGIHPDCAKDFLAAMNRVRKDITTGCTVRMELAQKNMEKGKDGLFKRLDGESGIRNIMDRFFDQVLVDTRIKGFFMGKNHDAVKEGARIYLTEAFGGPKIYKGRELAEIHTAVGVSDYEFDCFLLNMERAMSGLAFDDETVDEVIVCLEPIRPSLLGRARGLAARAKVVDGQTVLERMGGEQAVEGVVETMFAGLVLDARVKSYFEGMKDRIGGVRQKFAAVAVGGFGGATTIGEKVVRKAHYGMNITDYHFDAMMENFYCACELMEIEKDVIVDATDVLWMVRNDVTAGCTVRLEVARKKSESGGTDNLFTALGQEKGITLLVDAQFENLKCDKRVMHFFGGAKIETVVPKVRQYLALLFGGVVEYTGRSLDRIHSTMAISDYEFDCFLEALKQGMRTLGLDTQTADECVVMLEVLRPEVLCVRKTHNIKRAMQAISAKTVYERVGGQQGVTDLVEGMYTKAVQDPRVKSFFEKNKARVTAHKKRIVLYMTGIFGGMSTYDNSDLRPAHYESNITDYHFDCLMELIREVLKENGKEQAVIADVLIRLQPARADVTTGFTVRMEVARKNVEKGKDGMFQRLGGMAGLDALIEALYKVAWADARIKDLLMKDIAVIKAGQGAYIGELLGGPKSYKGRELVDVHKSLGINDYHFDCFLADLARAMMGLGHPEAMINEILVSVEPSRAAILGHSRGNGDVELSRDGVLLIDRFGGDGNVEAVVESMFDRCLEDSRVRFHFERTKSKQRQIRRQFCNYLTGCFGGLNTYDLSGLRKAHYNVNITDYHFDVMTRLFRDAAKYIGVDKGARQDAMLVLSKARPDITTGCAVRLELAFKKQALHGADELFQRLGAFDGLMAVIDRMFECVERDKRINAYFEGTKLIAIKKSTSEYIMSVLGGPNEYNGRTLAEAHSVLQVTDYHFDCFLQNLNRAMGDLGCSTDAVDDATIVLEPLRFQVLQAHYEKNAL
mmetsp:Transcript_51405/g.135605  ORF Transcript_51405/g.135605 Transcript_51405/m.135605 type:complete len:1160 (+) Transcript_51405:44-3523(+)